MSATSRPGASPARPAVFLDKDGTLIEDVPYNVDPALITLMPGVREALPRLRDAGFRLVVITNQSGVARGLYTPDDQRAVERRLRELLAEVGVELDLYLFCPHLPEGTVPEYAIACECRKPEPGLLLRAAGELGIDLARSWFVGDILNDVEAGHRAGTRAILVDVGKETEWIPGPLRVPDATVGDMAAAADVILAAAVEGRDPDGRSEPEAAASEAPRTVNAVLDGFPDLRVLVLGEAMLDSYLSGSASRIAREAPVPIVALADRADAPGGAANTAVNLAHLGATVHFLSVVGDDAEGELLLETLRREGVATDHVHRQVGRRTLAKTRVSADGQLIVRFDQGDTDDVDGEVQDRLVGWLRSLAPAVDALVVSDYAYGVLTPRLVEELRDLQAAHPRLLVVDAKEPARYRECRVTAVKPNYAEAVRMLAEMPSDVPAVRLQQLSGRGRDLLALTGARICAVTLDRDGALVFDGDEPPYRTYADARPNSRAAGAGDTYVSALTLALAAGGTTTDAAEIAAAAAATVVAKEGTVSCRLDELRGAFHAEDKILTRAALITCAESWQRQGRRVVFTNGVFDILHRGHIQYLNRAKALGDVLVVGVNDDASVRRLKGPERPVNGVHDRMEVLAALSSVDHIVAFKEDTPAELLRIVRPQVYVKGGDYTRERLPETPLVESLGGEVRILPFLEDRSTTRIIERLRRGTPATAARSTSGSASRS